MFLLVLDIGHKMQEKKMKEQEQKAHTSKLCKNKQEQTHKFNGLVPPPQKIFCNFLIGIQKLQRRNYSKLIYESSQNNPMDSLTKMQEKSLKGSRTLSLLALSTLVPNF